MNRSASRTIRRGAMALVASALLAGCGGNGSSPPPAAPQGTSNIEISGLVTKGIVGLGTILAQELNSSGDVIASIGETSTSVEGHYKFKLGGNYAGGPVLMTARINSNSAIRCDTLSGCGERKDDIPDTNRLVNFGDWYRPDPFSMTTLLPGAEEGEIITANITPFTHMAAQYAREEGLLDNTVIARANSEVSNLLGGLDIVNTPAIDMTDPEARKTASATQIAYSALVAGVANLTYREVSREATDDTPAISRIDIGLGKLSSSFTGGVMVADDSTVGQVEDSRFYSLLEIVTEAKAVLDFRSINMVDTSGVIDQIESSIEKAPANQVSTIDPAPSPTLGDSKLSRVKALVEDLRTWAYLLNTDVLSKGTAFEEQIKLSQASAALVSDDLIDEIIIAAIDVASRYDGTPDLNQYPLDHHWKWKNFSSGLIANPSPGVFEITDGVFSAQVSADLDGQLITVEKEFATIDITLKLPDTTTPATTHAYDIVSASISSSYADTTIDKGTITLNFSDPYTLNLGAMEITTLVLDADSVEFDLAMSLTQKWDYDASRQASIDNPLLTWVNVYYETPITFSGKLQTTVRPYVETDPTTGARTIDWATPSTLVLEGSASDTSGAQVETRLSANFTNADTFRPVSNSQIESADNWLSGNFGLTFSAQFDELPLTTVSVTGTRTGYQAGDIETTIEAQNQKLTLATRGDAAQDTIRHTVTITNQDGAVLTYDPATRGVSGVLSYNGKSYGTLYRTQSGYLKIEYIDGTFEIL